MGGGECDQGNLGAGTNCCTNADIPYCHTWKYSDIAASLIWCTDVRQTSAVVMFNEPFITIYATARPTSEEAPSSTETSEGKSEVSAIFGVRYKMNKDRKKEDQATSPATTLGSPPSTQLSSNPLPSPIVGAPPPVVTSV
ncbi:hypothetical protein F53441_108 [Fusarium austroafricanum]|uniref:Uncharacterized protein n=1 Tax=Fusarium austroafricanum TaxID=2364996 RepID=A0A8H4P3T5_9HYPO|nr:hypothetical protein F53441_108 [Fusarium austroafricanum]